MNKLPPITATVITLNEENNIVDCIHSLRDVCQEVVVLDSNSSDQTRALAQREGAKVYVQDYLGDGPQKAKAAEFANTDWILSIDADERVDTDLRNALINIDLTNPQIAYAFRRKNYLGDHQIQAGGFYPDYVTRLYNRTTSGYELMKKHASVSSPKLKKIKAHFLHYTYTDLSDWINRINWLSSRDAQAMYRDGRKAASPTAHAIAAFIRKFILQGGFLKGQDGMTVALTTTFNCYMKYLKLHEFYQEAEKNVD